MTSIQKSNIVGVIDFEGIINNLVAYNYVIKFLFVMYRVCSDEIFSRQVQNVLF